MRIRALSVAAALAAPLAFAQNFEIRGTLTDPDLKAGIAGAEVSLYTFTPDATREVVRTLYASTTTGADGGFQFHPDHQGEYYVELKKEGYMSLPPRGLEARVFLRGENSSQDFDFLATRPGEVTGRVIDPEGKPVAGVRVTVQPGEMTPAGVRVVAAGRSPSLLNVGGEKTDEGGFFTAVKLPPGSYTVSVAAPQESGMMMRFSADDVKKIDQGYEGPTVNARVSSGTSVDAGVIEVQKTPRYRAHLTIKPEECAPGEKWTFRGPGSGDSGFDCRPDLLVRNLKPGSYTFVLWSGGSGDAQSKWALTTVDIRRGNAETGMSMIPCANFEGRVVAADGVTLPALNGVRLGMESAGINGPNVPEASVDSQGRFAFKGVLFPRHRTRLYGLPAPYYVKEIRYNGLPLTSEVFTVSPGPGQQLEFVIDDKGSTLNGTVTESDQPVSRPQLVLTRWPLLPDSSEAAMLFTKLRGDDSGRFQVAGLAPGDYRILALPAGNVDNDTLVRLLNYAEKVALDPGGSQNVSLKLTRP